MSADPFMLTSQGVSSGLNVMVQGVKGLDVLNKNVLGSMSQMVGGLFNPLAKSLGLPTLGQAGARTGGNGSGGRGLNIPLPNLGLGQAAQSGVRLALPNIADFGPLQLGQVVDKVARSGVNSGLLAGGTAASRDDGPTTT